MGAHVSAAKTMTGSWPWLLPGFLQIPIDLVFSNRSFSFEYGPAFGSDHRSMFVQLEGPANE